MDLPAFSTGINGTVIIHKGKRQDKKKYKEIVQWLRDNECILIGQGHNFSKWEITDDIKFLLHLKFSK